MTLSLEDARKIAEAAAEENIGRWRASPQDTLLRVEYHEGGSCWFFFRNPLIEIPPGARIGGECAYAISKLTGEVRFTADFSDEPQRIEEYARTMSDFFVRNAGCKVSST